MSRIPLPQSLDKECLKASKILNSFIKTSGSNGPDKFIPPNILANAKGIAFMTVLKAGFIWSGRVGSGLVVARLPDGSWSAPSAIGTAGAGVGGQIGAEMTDFVMILNTPSAVKAFTHGGNFTLGGNLTVAAGPFGRSAEASGAVLNVAPVYSYSKSKGLFAGVSLEGSAIIERKDANSKLYGRPVRATELLDGTVPPPPQADVLYRALDLKASPMPSMYNTPSGNVYGTGAQAGPYGGTTTYGSSGPGLTRNDTTTSNSGPYGGSAYGAPDSVNPPGPGGSYLNRSLTDASQKSDISPPGYGTTSSAYGASSTYGAASNYGAANNYGAASNYGTSSSAGASTSNYYNNGSTTDKANESGGYSSYQSAPLGDSKAQGRGPPPPPPTTRRPSGLRAVAMYDFTGEQAGDLPFTRGDLIHITKKTESQNDWWEGTCNGRSGQFPANYVRMD